MREGVVHLGYLWPGVFVNVRDDGDTDRAMHDIGIASWLTFDHCTAQSCCVLNTEAAIVGGLLFIMFDEGRQIPLRQDRLLLSRRFDVAHVLVVLRLGVEAAGIAFPTGVQLATALWTDVLFDRQNPKAWIGQRIFPCPRLWCGHDDRRFGHAALPYLSSATAPPA